MPACCTKNAATMRRFLCGVAHMTKFVLRANTLTSFSPYELFPYRKREKEESSAPFRTGFFVYGKQ